MSSNDLKDPEVAKWNRKLDFCRELRRPFEEQWYTNYAFFKGRQWVVWDRTLAGNRLVEPALAQNRVRIVSNKIRPIIRRETAKLTKQEPVWYVVPNTAEPSDVSAARIAQALTEYSLNVADFPKVRRLTTFWSSICGSGFYRTHCPGKNEDIVIETVIPWHLFVPELQTEDLHSQPYVIIEKAMTKDAVETMFNIKLPEKVATSSVGSGLLEQRFWSALGLRTPNTDNKEMVNVKEIWVRPGAMKEYEEGAFLVIAGEEMVYRYHYTPKQQLEDALLNPGEEDPATAAMAVIKPGQAPTNYPYAHNKFPFHKQDAIPSGAFYGESVIVDLIPLQKERNKTRSQMIESKNRTSNPKLAYYKGSIDATKVTGQPGQMLPVLPGYEMPKYIEGAQGPTAQTQEIEMLDRDMDDISNQFEVTRGSTPPGVEAASAIAYLQEENDSVLHYNVESIASAIRGVGKQTLELAQQFWDDEKIIQIVSKNNAQDAMIFKISDIKGNTDLRIESESIAPQSRAARQAFLTGLIKDGIIPAEKGLRYLQMNETSRLYEEMQVDSRQAQRENYTMAHVNIASMIAPQPEFDDQGNPNPEAGMPGKIKPFGTNPFDNHEIHIYEHGLFMKSQEYELLGLEQKTLLLNHWLQHQQTMEGDIARATELESGEPSSPTGEPPIPGEPPV